VLRLVPPELGLNSWTLEEALRPLSRFVIGDGERQGFVFSHPRLGDYFHERLGVRERQTTEARFLSWGEQTLAALTVQLATQPASFLYPPWAQALPLLANSTRHDLLFDLRFLMPVIIRLGGPRAVADIFQAIQDVGRWWP
jgi:hypothetical protein